MAWLATTPVGVPVRATDLSTATGIPTHYLSKVMRRMVVAGLLISQKGQGGGFLLSKPPAEIPFIDILTAVDAFPVEGRCAFGWGDCDENRPCPLHKSWKQMNERLRSWASDTSLADIESGGARYPEAPSQ